MTRSQSSKAALVCRSADRRQRRRGRRPRRSRGRFPGGPRRGARRSSLAICGEGLVSSSTESCHQRAVKLLHELQGRPGSLGRRALLGGGPVDEAPPAVDGGVQTVAEDGQQQRATASHAEADAADLAGHVRPRAQLVGCPLEVSEDDLVGHREKPCQDRFHVAVRRGSAFARVKVDSQGDIALVGDTAGDIPGVLGQATAVWTTIMPGNEPGAEGRAR